MKELTNPKIIKSTEVKPEEIDRETIRKALLDVGAVNVGFAQAGEVDAEFHELYKKWIGEGNHGDMSYLERHIPLRRHTDSVLPGAETVISLAFSYVPKEWRPLDIPMIAAYAYGEDYHKSLRKILKPVVKGFREKYGGNWRICIDSAPIAERFWAMKSGIGKLGLNSCIIVEGCGSLCFLTEILTTHALKPDMPSVDRCDNCGRCAEICPAHAIGHEGNFHATRCINYLMIEKRTPLSTQETQLLEAPPGHILGCDRCLRICPHNNLLKLNP